MKKLWMSAAVVGLSAMAMAPASYSRSEDKGLVGQRVDDFRLIDQAGDSHSLYYLSGSAGVVIMTHAGASEAVARAATALEGLKSQYADRGFEFFMLNSSLRDDRASLKAEADKRGYTIPILDDEYQLIGGAMGVTRASEAVLIDPDGWKVIYNGPVDGLRDAMEAALAGRDPARPFIPVRGDALAFPDRARKAEFAKISYTDTIAPILMENCVDCHQPGGIGPWHMTSYEMVKGFAPMIRESIRTDRMPPYDVDPHIGRFENNENLSEKDIRSLIHWIEAGAPRGQGADPLKEARLQRAEWPLGEPDLVVEIPPFEIPASGVVEYQTPAIPSPFTEGKWLKATTFKAGSRESVHHILAGWLPRLPEGGNGFSWDLSMGGYAVGAESNLSPENAGTFIPAGGAFSFQMHYTPFGKPVTDRSKVAFYFHETPPDLIMRQQTIADFSIEIPAGAARHVERAYMKFPADALIYAAQPHAHLRGHSSKLTLRTPDGVEKVILSMPKYDFNWQREYIFEEMIKAPKGSLLIAEYVYDNSARNRSNPDPTQTISWGDQSFEEMLFTAFRYRWAEETAANRKDDYEQALRGSLTMGMLDDNVDGKIQLTEIRGPRMAPMRAGFALADANKDGGIDETEFSAVSRMMGGGRRGGGRPAPAPTTR